MMRLVQNFQKKIDRSVLNYNFVVSCWGNDFEDSFRGSFDFTNYQDSFFPESNVLKSKVSVVLVSGQLNSKMLFKLQKYLKTLEGSEYITVRLRGALDGEPSIGDEELRANLVSEISFDLEYKKFPYDLNEIIQAVIDLRDGTHEE